MGTRTWGQTIYSSNGLAASGFTYDPATLALDKETITYTLPNQPAFTRILDRSQDSLARTTGYTLGTPTSPSAFETQATYGYSATTGRLETVSNGTSTFRYDYLPNSSLIEHVVATAGAVHDIHLAYEPIRNVLASRQNKVGTDVISQYDYSVNSIGQRSAVAQVGTAFQAVRAIAWQYDSLGQVIQADSSENTHDRAYQYDTIGNRKKTSNTLTLPGTDNWTANPLNQLTKVNGEDLPADSYDSDGNQINAKVLPLGSSSLASCVYSWDAENRLISATVNGTTTTYLYDAQSRRIATTTGGETTVYVYDKWNCIAEYGSAGVSPASYSLTKTRLWGTDLSGSLQGAGGVGGLLAEKQGTNTYFPTFDGNGNVSEYLAADGAVAAHFEYDPFGNTVVNTGTTNQFAYRFSTKPLDPTTGLFYYGYRFYDPLTGRWPSRDPIEEKGGVNLYGFVENDGVSYWDVAGLMKNTKPIRKMKRGVATMIFDCECNPDDFEGGKDGISDIDRAGCLRNQKISDTSLFKFEVDDELIENVLLIGWDGDSGLQARAEKICAADAPCHLVNQIEWKYKVKIVWVHENGQETPFPPIQW